MKSSWLGAFCSVVKTMRPVQERQLGRLGLAGVLTKEAQDRKNVSARPL